MDIKPKYIKKKYCSKFNKDVKSDPHPGEKKSKKKKAIQNTFERRQFGEFPGSPVSRTPLFHCQGQRFNPW